MEYSDKKMGTTSLPGAYLVFFTIDVIVSTIAILTDIPSELSFVLKYVK